MGSRVELLAGQQGTLSPVDPRTSDVPPQHRDLVAQHQQLGIPWPRSRIGGDVRARGSSAQIPSKEFNRQ
jgi:hypothetical protein